MGIYEEQQESIYERGSVYNEGGVYDVVKENIIGEIYTATGSYISINRNNNSAKFIKNGGDYCISLPLNENCETKDNLVFSFDVTDFSVLQGGNVKGYIYNFFGGNGTDAPIVISGVGHYSFKFNPSAAKIKKERVDLQFRYWLNCDDGDYFIIKNIKLERNIHDTEYNVSPSEVDNRVKIGKHYYHTCVIGRQQWLSENLNEDLGGGTWEGYYNNDPSYGVKGYGKLYTWDCICSANETPSAAMAKLLKDGWRVPTKSDFDSLVTTVGAANYSKVKEKWYWPTAGTNESGFSAVCGGIKQNNAWSYNSTGFSSSTLSGTNTHNLLYIVKSGIVVASTAQNEYGWSVRLVRDVPATQSDDDGISVISDFSEPAEPSEPSDIAEDDD